MVNHVKVQFQTLCNLTVNIGFCLGQSEKMRKAVYRAQKGQVVSFDDLIQVEVKEGKINHVSLSADQLQLYVSVLGGTLLTYNVHDIVQQVCVSDIQLKIYHVELINFYRKRPLHHRRLMTLEMI
jgi:hypothetical protein